MLLMMIMDGWKLNANPTLLFLLAAVIALGLAAIGYYVSRWKAVRLIREGNRPKATPDYYGLHTVLLMFLPALGISIVLAILRTAGLVDASNLVWIGTWCLLPALILLPAVKLVRMTLNARVLVERSVYMALMTAALLSIVTTLGILLSVLFESIRFFQQVSLLEFLFGTTWSPGGAFLESAGRSGEQGTDSQFGALPLFAGTLMMTTIAMLVAVPLGLMAAIYTAEYARPGVRRAVKPMLEILAGIPTVVYGFFAAITLAPMIVKFAGWIGLHASLENALAPGVVMGVMVIPFMSSLCDDIISSLPQNIRLASMALGSTRSEMIKRVVLPAAMPGIMSAFLLCVSRAIGETMIVVMAAGMAANLTANPLEQVTTVTVHIVANLTGDLAYDNPQTLSAFGLGLTLLVITLVFNIISAIIIRKFRQRYEGD
jgi:phosphate transport system permease protein